MVIKDIRLAIATDILNGMLSSAAIVDRHLVEKDKWCKVAVEWADKLIKANTEYTGY